jgi:hypothetical protein
MRSHRLLGAGLAAGWSGGSFALAATDGRPPYRWRVTSGALPAGLSLSPSLSVAEALAAGANHNLRYAEWAWHHPADDGW